jgi:REP element-mobilizing transposase RayT
MHWKIIMPGQPSPPRRRHARLKEYDYRQTGAYFVTICSYQRACIFGKIISGNMHINDFGQIVLSCWQQIPIHFSNTVMDAFVVMPNHIHGIILITNYPAGPCQASLEEQIINPDPVGARHASPLQRQQPINPVGPRQASPAWRHPSLGHLVGAFKSASTRQIRNCVGLADFAVWQRNYYEHIIRNDKSLTRIREYIFNNPLSWHLDRENQEATGQDDFDRWLDNQKTVPVKKTTP